MSFDPHDSWRLLREQAAVTTNPRHQKLLDEVANHMEAEIKGNLDALMNTLTAEPIYHFWRVGPENMVLQGYDAVRGFYSDMFSQGRQQFHVVLDRIVVDDHAVITEGQVRQVYSAQQLADMGVEQVGDELVSHHELWITNAQLITVWPADEDGKLVGEDIYFGADAMTTLAPFAAADLPSYYQRH